MNQLNDGDIIIRQVEQFCEKIEVSPVGENKKINPNAAVFHTITNIREIVRKIVGKEQMRITGRMLLNTMRYGVGILENEGKSVNDITYAITREGIQNFFKEIKEKENKSVPGKRDIDLPMRNGTCISGTGGTFYRGSSEYS